MNTSTQHPPCLPGTPQEGNLSVSQNSQIESIQGNIKKIVWVIGTAIEDMKQRKEELLEKQKIKEIVLAIEKFWSIQLDDFSWLIQKTGNINANDPTWRTALFRAASIGHLEIVQLLLAHPKIQVNEKDSGEETALMVAVKCGYLEITKLLLARPEIQINEKSSPGLTVLIWAAEWGHQEITKLLLADPRLKLEEHDQGKKALEQAKTPEIKALIEEAMKKQGIPF
jgi:ankyrin repeat protein